MLNCRPLDSSVHGISQAKVLEQVAIPVSRGIFLTQGLNPSLLHWQTDSLSLSHQGSPLISYVDLSVMFSSLQPHGLKPTGLLYPWNSPGKNNGVGSHSLFQGIFPIQGIFPTQGSNPGLPHGRQILYRLSYQGSPPIQNKKFKKKKGRLRRRVQHPTSWPGWWEAGASG